MRRYAAVLALLTACTDDDPCDGVATCVRLAISSSTVARIDQLELDIVYADHHATTTAQPDGGGTASLPLATAIVLEGIAADTRVGVVAAGKLGAGVQGTGAGALTLSPGTHATLALVLSPVENCNAGAFYCGGDRLAGDPDTMYTCNAGGVPIARGVCASGCLVRPGRDDVCRASGGVCLDGGRYCGGDKLDGDPGTLYVCQNGAGSAPTICSSGCLVRPGNDDACR